MSSSTYLSNPALTVNAVDLSTNARAHCLRTSPRHKTLVVSGLRIRSMSQV
jgi:hypothetical protein